MADLAADERALLSGLARKHGLQEHIDAIAPLARPASRAVSLGKDGYARAGGSRFGGHPDLPPDLAWPSREKSSLPGAAIFIAQIELATLPYAPPGMPLDGLLSLFVQGTDAASMPVDVHAFHFVEGTPLARRRAPPKRELCDEDLLGLRPLRIGWERTVVLADLISSGLVDRLESQWESLYALASDLEGALGGVGGHARDHDGTDLRLSAVLEREGHRAVESVAMFESADGLEAFLPTAEGFRRRQLERLSGEAAWWFEHRDRLLAECERWHCVLRVESNEAMDLQINDADPLFILAHEDDLAAGRFDRMTGRVLQG